MTTPRTYLRALAAAFGALACLASTYVAYATTGEPVRYVRPAWQFFFTALLGAAGCCAVSGSLARNPRRAAVLLTVAAGTLTSLALMAIFSIGILLLPVAGLWLLTGIGRDNRLADDAPQVLILCMAAPFVVAFGGLLALYR